MNLKKEYLKWKKRGVIPARGLCNVLEGTKYRITLLDLSPTPEDIEILCIEQLTFGYWGSNMSIFSSRDEKSFTFSTLRENIVLFILAIHGEI